MLGRHRPCIVGVPRCGSRLVPYFFPSGYTSIRTGCPVWCILVFVSTVELFGHEFDFQQVVFAYLLAWRISFRLRPTVTAR